MDILRGQAGWRILRHAACAPPPPTPTHPPAGAHPPAGDTRTCFLVLSPFLMSAVRFLGAREMGARSAQTGWLVKASASHGIQGSTSCKRAPPPPDRARTHAARVLT